MQLLQLIFNNSVTVTTILVMLLLFGGIFIRNIIVHRENMQKMKNEELQLQIQLANQKKPQPKQDTWNEEKQEYGDQEGYQQQQQ